MKIYSTSNFKSDEESSKFLNYWILRLSLFNNKSYIKQELNTSLGKTIVWEFNNSPEATETLVIFPGYRTSALFWDFDNALDVIGKNIRIFLIETNGQANLSDGNTPDIKTLDYGIWATEVLKKLDIKETHIAGASFGGLICMKLCLVSPTLVKSCILLNPGCFRFISLSFKNLYYNLLPIIKPTEQNVKKFLTQIVFHKPHHYISKEAEEILNEYLLFAISNHQYKNQKPYNMSKDLFGLSVPVHLIFGSKDVLLPYKKSLKNAKINLKNIKSTTIFEHVGHGIETHKMAIHKINEIINDENYDKDTYI